LLPAINTLESFHRADVVPGLLAVSKYLSSYGIVIKRVSTLFCAGLFSLVVFILNDLRITDAEMQFFRYYFEFNFAQ
jgi:predicted amino acid-binding ACT domain protein